MKQVTSKDGTTIAFDQSGQGQPIILVDGALVHRAFEGGTPLAAQLAPHFTVFVYDRRGRGESGDTQPYAIEREVEDIEALINEAGGSAFVYGISSGAALALEAALKLGSKIKKLAIYEPPYNADASARQRAREYSTKLRELIAAGRRGDAVAHFMGFVGMPAEAVAGMRQSPIWPIMEGIGHTLAYDSAIMGEDHAVPAARAASVTVPTLVIAGGSDFPWMRDTATALATNIPGAQVRFLDGQGHNVAPEVLAPVLVEFFAR
jgi:pimeloyl-ACP methyl ester carboxylesterase